MKLITAAHRQQLTRNGQATAAANLEDRSIDRGTLASRALRATRR